MARCAPREGLTCVGRGGAGEPSPAPAPVPASLPAPMLPTIPAHRQSPLPPAAEQAPAVLIGKEDPCSQSADERHADRRGTQAPSAHRDGRSSEKRATKISWQSHHEHQIATQHVIPHGKTVLSAATVPVTCQLPCDKCGSRLSKFAASMPPSMELDGRAAGCLIKCWKDASSEGSHSTRAMEAKTVQDHPYMHN
eukprot:352887-Chlamydomonas_euryale.AAC.5